MDPNEMKDLMRGLYAGCMKGRRRLGEISRVLEWAIERIEGKAAAVQTPIGHVPTSKSLDTTGLDLCDAELEAALAVDAEEWTAEIPQLGEWFAKFGDTLPTQLRVELGALKARLGVE